MTITPLKDIRILDLSRILAGPTCTQLLGDLGADIIKVERPGSGDDTRSWGPPFLKDKDGKDTQNSAYFNCANRNKRSVCIDITTKEGASTIHHMASQCDVFVENFKVGGLKKYDLAYEDIKAINPKIVYCSITGFGQTGPNAHRPGYDVMAQGYGGIMSLTGDPAGDPMKTGVGIADIMCGMYASTAILAALRHAEKTGQGQHIDLALVDTQIAWLINEGTNYLTSGEAPKRLGNQHPNIVPYQVFEAQDGHVIIAVGNDTQFERFCTFLDLSHLCRDPRFQTNPARITHRDILIPLIAEKLHTLSCQMILEGLEKVNVPAGPVHTVAEVFASDQVRDRQMKIDIAAKEAQNEAIPLIGNPIKLSETPITYQRPPPFLGQHTDEVLRELCQDMPMNASAKVTP